MSIKLVMPINHLNLCHPLLLLTSIFPSIRVFSNETVLCIRWPKYWRFSISPSNEHSGLISFRIDWLDFLAVQGTLKSLLQHQFKTCSKQFKSISSSALSFLYSQFSNGDNISAFSVQISLSVVSALSFLYSQFSNGDNISAFSVQISLSVVSDSVQPHESQHARPPYPSSTPGVHSDSPPSSQ